MVPIHGKIHANPFNALTKEVTLFRVERHSIFLEDFTDTAEVMYGKHWLCGRNKAIVNNVLSMHIGGVLWVLVAEQLMVFILKNFLHGSVHGGCIARAKGHHCIAILLSIWGHERQFLLVLPMHGDLMVTRLGVKADKVHPTLCIPKVVERVIAPWNGVLKWLSNSIEGLVIDAEAPNEVFN